MKEKKDQKLVDEINMLRTEVKQLKEMVNMLVEIVVDMDGEEEEFGADIGLGIPGRNNKMSFCM